MISAWQAPLGDLAEERLVRFGRIRRVISVAVVEDDRGVRVEARCGRKLVTRIDVGVRDQDRLRDAIERAHSQALAAMLEAL
jgi:hypothetical protein